MLTVIFGVLNSLKSSFEIAFKVVDHIKKMRGPSVVSVQFRADYTNMARGVLQFRNNGERPFWFNELRVDSLTQPIGLSMAGQPLKNAVPEYVVNVKIPPHDLIEVECNRVGGSLSGQFRLIVIQGDGKCSGALIDTSILSPKNLYFDKRDEIPRTWSKKAERQWQKSLKQLENL